MAARTFLQLAYALDRRARKKDGIRLVPWDLDPVRLPPLETWAEVNEAYARLQKLTRQMPRGFRREWLTDHLPTLEGLISLEKGRVPTLPEQVRAFYGLPAKEAKETELEHLRSQVRRLLPGAREDGLRKSVEAWERQQRVAKENVLPAMSRYLQEARKGARKMFDLPAREHAALVGVLNSRSSGYCWYTHDYQSTIKLNVALPWTHTSLRDMAAHEGYPGHHVHQATREWEYLHGDFPREAAVSMAADPMGPVEEGIGENGMHFIHWDRTRDDRLRILLGRIRWGTEVNLAWMAHREESRRELLRYAMHSGLVDWQQAVRDVRNAAHRFWASYGFCYWFGTSMIRKKYEKMDGDTAFFDVLYWKPHTVRSLEKAFRRI